LGEVIEEDYACTYMKNKFEVIDRLALIKVEECVYDYGEFSPVGKE